MEKEVRIVISSGLILLACLHAGLIATANRIAPRVERSLGIPALDAPSASIPREGINWDAMQGDSSVLPRRSLPVNAAARDEMKQGQYFPGQVVKQPSNCVPCQPTVTPAPRPIAAPQVTSLATTPKNQLILFVGNDSKSQQLLNWFNSDSQLQSLKAKTNFNLYTKDNALYRARYQDTVPVEYFPAALLTAPDGGHIHIAFGDMMPSDAATLYADFAKAYKLQRQVVEQRRNSQSVGAADSLSISSAVDQIQDCIDGNCNPLNRNPMDDNQRDRVFPNLDRHRPDNFLERLVSGLSNPTETILVVALGGVIGYLVLTRMRG